MLLRYIDVLKLASRFPSLVLLQVKPELAAVSKVDNSVESFARSNYDVSCEVAINEQVSQMCNCCFDVSLEQ